MAANDPTMGVATPTGVLQGVAAFSWDGSAWQPAGRAGPSVATPTGVLRGVAAFNGGPSWQPSGRAQPGVATPTGVLDGVAVYTWSGNAWAPPGGTETPATPSGALRGVAAFNWDGAAWQPAGQAGPSVATPYGVLDGVAMFNWTGTVWAAVAAPSLSLDFMTPGTLDPRITFARASTATYFDATGTMQTAATNAPRWDYDPVTHALRGMLIEEQRANVVGSSGNFSTGWAAGNVTVTPGLAGAPDGTASMSRLAETATATVFHYVVQLPTVVASQRYTMSVYAKAAEVRYLQIAMDDGGTPNGGYATFDLLAGTVSGAPAAVNGGSVGAATIQPVGNGIYRCAVAITIGALTSGRCWYVPSNVPTPGFLPTYTGNPANGLQIWGGQVEPGAYPTSYIATTAGAVTRSPDQCSIPTAAWFNATNYSVAVECIAGADPNATIAGVGDVTPANAVYIAGVGVARFGVGSAASSAMTAGAVSKIAGSYTSAQMRCCTNAGAVGTAASSAQAAVSRLSIGSTPWGLDSQFNAPMRRIRYWPRVLSDAEMQSVTA